MTVSINRDGVCMGDDAMDHRQEIEMEDTATSRDLLEKLLEMQYLPNLSDAIWYTGSLQAACKAAETRGMFHVKHPPLFYILLSLRLSPPAHSRHLL